MITHVLVLNASCEGLHYVPLRRAVALLLAKKAELVEASERRIHSMRMVLPEPRVIRLLRYVFVPFKADRVTRHKLLRRDGRCQYCGREGVSLTVSYRAVAAAPPPGRTAWPPACPATSGRTTARQRKRACGCSSARRPLLASACRSRCFDSST